jgi:hypothetical protein
LWPLAKNVVICGTDNHDQVLFTIAASLFRVLLPFFNNMLVLRTCFQDRISAANEIVNESVRTGEPVGTLRFVCYTILRYQLVDVVHRLVGIE